VLTTNRVMFHFFYINGHILFAALLLGAVGLGWLAVRTRSWILLLPASMMFGALIPLRAESAIVVGVFLFTFLSSQEIPLRWRWALLAPSVVATLIWDGWVLPHLLSESSLALMKSPLSELAVVAGLILLVTVSSVKEFRKIALAMPWMLLGSLVVLLGVLVWRDPQIMSDTLVGMSSAMTATGRWSTFWLVVPFLFFGAVIIGFPRDRYVVFGVFAFTLVIPILAYLRGARFHEGSGDSANRMLMHVVPLLILVVILAAGKAEGLMERGVRGVSHSSEENLGSAGEATSTADLEALRNVGDGEDPLAST
jgi:hypothetical protein